MWRKNNGGFYYSGLAFFLHRPGVKKEYPEKQNFRVKKNGVKIMHVKNEVSEVTNEFRRSRLQIPT